jgi:hypothetical protein
MNRTEAANRFRSILLETAETRTMITKTGRNILPKQTSNESERLSNRVPRFRNHRGTWVFSSGTPISLAETNRVTSLIRRGSRSVIQ